MQFETIYKDLCGLTSLFLLKCDVDNEQVGEQWNTKGVKPAAGEHQSKKWGVKPNKITCPVSYKGKVLVVWRIDT